MTDWPISGDPNRLIISPFSPAAVGVDMGGVSAAAGASVAHGTANLARGYPIYISEPCLIVKVWWFNGATVSGNTDVGLYTLDGTRLFSSGAVAQATVSVMQESDITDYQIGRGTYYCALSTSSATATYLSTNFNLHFAKAMGWFQMASAHVLPATITPAALSSAIEPLFGISLRTLVA